MLERKLNENYLEPISSNYYPMVYSTYLRNNSTHLNFITNSTLGFGVLESGELEYMIHRRTAYDDGRGVDEPLLDTDIGHFKLRISLEDAKNGLESSHRGKYETNFPIVPFQLSGSFDKVTPMYSSVSADLPDNLHVLNFELIGKEDNEMIIRIINLHERNGATSIIMGHWLRKFKITKMLITSLTTLTNLSLHDPLVPVVIKPMEIKTFRVIISK
jgi:hypothetical protein